MYNILNHRMSLKESICQYIMLICINQLNVRVYNDVGYRLIGWIPWEILLDTSYIS